MQMTKDSFHWLWISDRCWKELYITYTARGYQAKKERCQLLLVAALCAKQFHHLPETHTALQATVRQMPKHVQGKSMNSLLRICSLYET